MNVGKTEMMNTFQNFKIDILFDDGDDPDNGLAVIISPDEEVMTQDEYL